MDKIFAANLGVSPPSTPGIVGYPQDGDVTAGRAATIPGAYWFWMITSELLALIVGAGLTPSGTVLNQVFTAVSGIANTAAADAVTTATATVLGWFTGTHQNLTPAKGFQDFPGGRTHQWVEASAPATGNNDVVITYYKAFTGTAPIPSVTIVDVSLAGGSPNFLGYAVTARSLTGCTISFGTNGGSARDITIRVDAWGNT